MFLLTSSFNFTFPVAVPAKLCRFVYCMAMNSHKKFEDENTSMTHFLVVEGGGEGSQ